MGPPMKCSVAINGRRPSARLLHLSLSVTQVRTPEVIYRGGGGGDGSGGGGEGDSKTRWAFDEIVGEIQNDKSLSVCLDQRGCSPILSPSITSLAPHTTHKSHNFTLLGG